MELNARMFEFTDEIGPEKIIHLYEPRTKMKAIVVVDNVAAGPAIGGVRMAPDVTMNEVRRLARAMTYKNVMASLPHGGGKSGIIADPKTVNKEQVIRTFARGIKNLLEYIPGPDMGTDEASMAYVYDEIDRAVGLPRELGGIPLDEIGATGYGVAECADVAKDYINLDLNGARVTIEGFGNVGKPAARFLAEKGAVLVGTSDSIGTIYNSKGLNVEELIRIKESTGSVINYKDGEILKTTDLLLINTDIFIPSARPDVITDANSDVVDAKLIIQGANIPITESAEKLLHDRGILVIPDFVANAGGVITASVEYHGGTEMIARDRIKSTIRKNTKEILDKVYSDKTYPRETAMGIAKQRVMRAMKYREWM
ncbi:MAG: Glu/Leu/Phe/Val dehydrogenase [Candidatus Methanoperedens sp.]|nr:Glu/Leu/Phe/Val dehydrogenase [Candidatus Methanoperedens sp.]CAG0997876.1 glutamate dehydrogenase (NAD(P)+) [Methanosarcinales archaeon]